MERQAPIWPPGERQAYHAITLGFYENELVRRIDPGHRTIGEVLQSPMERQSPPPKSISPTGLAPSLLRKTMAAFGQSVVLTSKA